MVPRILFCCVAVIGVLAVFAMLSIAKRRLVTWCRIRARIKAQAARVAETARLRVEHAAFLATLHQSTVVLPPGPAIAAPPRARMPKGSISPPITKRAFPSRPPIPVRLP